MDAQYIGFVCCISFNRISRRYYRLGRSINSRVRVDAFFLKQESLKDVRMNVVIKKVGILCENQEWIEVRITNLLSLVV